MKSEMIDISIGAYRTWSTIKSITVKGLVASAEQCGDFAGSGERNLRWHSKRNVIVDAESNTQA